MRTKLVCNRYFPDPPGIVSAVVVEAQTKAPLAKGGCLGLPRRGDSVAKATELLTDSRFLIPSISLAPLEKGAFFVCGFFENFVKLKKNNHQKKDWG